MLQVKLSRRLHDMLHVSLDDLAPLLQIVQLVERLPEFKDVHVSHSSADSEQLESAAKKGC